MNEGEQVIRDYQAAVCRFRGMNPAEKAEGAECARRAASAALIIAFSGDGPLEVWREIGMKWAAVAGIQPEASPLAIAQ